MKKVLQDPTCQSNVCKTQFQTNLKRVQNVSKYHLNFQNDLKKLTCRFVTHNLRKKFKQSEKSTTRPKMATKCVSATNLVQTNLKHAQNVSRFHLNFQNDLTNIQYKFISHNLAKSSKFFKKTLQNPKCQLCKCNELSSIQT